jgi:hypothetical protein
MHTLPTKLKKGIKAHSCNWCGKLIPKGEPHEYWRSVGDGYTENRMHPKCLQDAIAAGDFVYKSKAKPKPAVIKFNGVDRETAEDTRWIEKQVEIASRTD